MNNNYDLIPTYYTTGIQVAPPPEPRPGTLVSYNGSTYLVQNISDQTGYLPMPVFPPPSSIVGEQLIQNNSVYFPLPYIPQSQYAQAPPPLSFPPQNPYSPPSYPTTPYSAHVAPSLSTHPQNPYTPPPYPTPPSYIPTSASPLIPYTQSSSYFPPQQPHPHMNTPFSLPYPHPYPQSAYSNMRATATATNTIAQHPLTQSYSLYSANHTTSMFRPSPSSESLDTNVSTITSTTQSDSSSRINSKISTSPSFLSSENLETTSLASTSTTQKETEIKKSDPKLIYYNVALGRASKRGDLKDALLTMERIRANNIKPDVYSYNSLINLYAKREDGNNVYKYVLEMINNKIEPDLATYRMIISFSLKSHNVASAIKNLELMQKKGVQPDYPLYSSVLSYCLTHPGLSDEALKIQEMMKNDKMTPREPHETYETLIQKYQDSGNLEGMFRILSILKEEKIKINPSTYSSWIAYCGKNNQELLLKSLMELVEENHILLADTTPSMLFGPTSNHSASNSSLAIPIGQEKAQSVKYVPIKGRKISTDISHYNRNLSEANVTNNLERAESLMKRICSTPGLKPNIQSYNPLIELYIKKKDVDNVNKYVSEMIDNGVEFNSETYKNLILFYLKLDQFANAMKYLEEMKKKNIQPSKFIYLSILRYCLIDSQLDEEAVKIQEMMIKDRILFEHSVYENAIQHASLERSLRIVEIMKRAGMRPSASIYKILIHLCGDYQDCSKAEELFHDMKQAGVKPTMFMYNIMIELYTKTNNSSKAKGCLQMINEDGLVPNENSFHILIRYFAEQKDFATVTSLYSDAKNKIQLRRETLEILTTCCLES